MRVKIYVAVITGMPHHYKKCIGLVTQPDAGLLLE